MSRSDGSTADYYELPEGATQLQDLISHRNLNAQLGEIFRACYRFGMADHSDQLRDAKKILFYAKAEVERLEKLKAKSEIPTGWSVGPNGSVYSAHVVIEPAASIDDDSPRAQVIHQNGEMASEIYAAIDGKPNWDDAPEWAMWLGGDNEGWFWFDIEPQLESDADEPDWSKKDWCSHSVNEYECHSFDRVHPQYKEPRPCQ